MPCYIWSSIKLQLGIAYKEHAILCPIRQRRVESYKCITNRNRCFYAYHKVLNWNSHQGNHQGWHRTRCTRPQAELGVDYKEWSLPGYNKNPTETVSGSSFASICWHTKYRNTNDYCMMGKETQNEIWSWRGSFVEYRAAVNAWCSWTAILLYQVRNTQQWYLALACSRTYRGQWWGQLYKIWCSVSSKSLTAVGQHILQLVLWSM